MRGTTSDRNFRCRAADSFDAEIIRVWANEENSRVVLSARAMIEVENDTSTTPTWFWENWKFQTGHCDAIGRYSYK